MIVCRTLEELAGLHGPLHLAFGVFDGVHAGHQEVLRRAISAADIHGGMAGLVTFDPHPIRVTAPGKAPKALLSSLDHKAAIAREAGIGLFVPLHFDETMAAMEAEEFLGKLCRANIATMAVGEDWRFGHNRAGGVELLRTWAEKHRFHLDAVPPVMIDGDRISSTRIRQAIRDGNLPDASRMLGRPYSITGEVVAGRKLGRTLGFPTANISVGEHQLPPPGVWVVRVTLEDGEMFPGVANLGTRPTVDGGEILLESHLFDFTGDLYGKTIDVAFFYHLRDERKFNGMEELRAQIALDAAAARKISGENI